MGRGSAPRPEGRLLGGQRVQAVAVAAALVVGVAAGLGGYTFVYARGASYLSNDPAVCANCHVMQGHLDGHRKSAHRHVAVCNDCHTPHHPVGKYLVKASNGFWHSFAFTSGRFPDPLRIKPGNREVTERACRHCHGAIVETIDANHRGGVECLHCHSEVGHSLRD